MLVKNGNGCLKNEDKVVMKSENGSLKKVKLSYLSEGKRHEVVLKTFVVVGFTTGSVD